MTHGTTTTHHRASFMTLHAVHLSVRKLLPRDHDCCQNKRRMSHAQLTAGSTTANELPSLAQPMHSLPHCPRSQHAMPASRASSASTLDRLRTKNHLGSQPPPKPAKASPVYRHRKEHRRNPGDTTALPPTPHLYIPDYPAPQRLGEASHPVPQESSRVLFHAPPTEPHLLRLRVDPQKLYVRARAPALGAPHPSTPPRVTLAQDHHRGAGCERCRRGYGSRADGETGVDRGESGIERRVGHERGTREEAGRRLRGRG